MDLGEYIAAIRGCPVEEVSDRFRIGENYRAYLKTDFGQLVRDLDRVDGLRYDPGLTNSMSALRKNGEYRFYRSVPPAVKLHVLSWITPYFGEDVNIGGYSATIMFTGEKEEEVDSDSARVFVDSVLHVLCYANEKGIPLFVPSSKIIHPGNSS